MTSFKSVTFYELHALFDGGEHWVRTVRRAPGGPSDVIRTRKEADQVKKKLEFWNERDHSGRHLNVEIIERQGLEAAGN
jgi:hypothetical protein